MIFYRATNNKCFLKFEIVIYVPHIADVRFTITIKVVYFDNNNLNRFN